MRQLLVRSFAPQRSGQTHGEPGLLPGRPTRTQIAWEAMCQKSIPTILGSPQPPNLLDGAKPNYVAPPRPHCTIGLQGRQKVQCSLRDVSLDKSTKHPVIDTKATMPPARENGRTSCKHSIQCHCRLRRFPRCILAQKQSSMLPSTIFSLHNI